MALRQAKAAYVVIAVLAVAAAAMAAATQASDASIIHIIPHIWKPCELIVALDQTTLDTESVTLQPLNLQRSFILRSLKV